MPHHPNRDILLCMLKHQHPGHRQYIVGLFLTVLALSGLFQGCGTSSNASQGEPNPPGVFTDSTLIDQLEKEFDELKACTQLSKGNFEDVSVVMMPKSFPCRWYDGACSGEFVVPNTVKLGSPYVWKHETIHYLLYLNTGDSDPDHQSPLYQTCS